MEGRFKATLSLESLLNGEQRGSPSATAPVKIVASWRNAAGNIELTTLRVLMTGTDIPGFTPVSTSIVTHYPGVPFSISAGRQRPGALATVHVASIDSEQCLVLESCSRSKIFQSSLDSSYYHSSDSIVDRFQLVRRRELKTLRTNASLICSGLSLDEEDWSQCRWELPDVGVFALVVCINRNNEDDCHVTYRCVSFFVCLFFLFFPFFSCFRNTCLLLLHASTIQTYLSHANYGTF
jgi:hypothetical protein